MRTTRTPRGLGADREDPAEIHAEACGPHLGRGRPAAHRTRRAAPGRPAFIVYAASRRPRGLKESTTR